MSQFGLTPLIWCAKTGQAEMAALLLDRGADIEGKDGVGISAGACRLAKNAFVAWWCQRRRRAHASAFKSSSRQVNLGRWSRSDSRMACVKLCSDLHSSENPVFLVLQLHRTALLWAASFGQLEVLVVLLAHGADMKVRDNVSSGAWLTRPCAQISLGERA